MENKSPTEQKVYCNILKEEISKSRCASESYNTQCKVCPQYLQKTQTNRWDYVKNHLLFLADVGHHNLYRWTLLVDDETLEGLLQAPIDFNKLQKEGLLEIQTVSEWEGLFHNINGLFIPENEIYRKHFESGDETAIFEFCQNFHFAFRSSWVVHQIEQWKLQKTKESMNKLKKLFGCYSDFRGKTSAERLDDLLSEDKKICDEVVELQKKGMNADQAIQEVSKNNAKGFKTVKDIYYGYKVDDSLKEQLSRTRKWLRETPDDDRIKKTINMLEQLVEKEIASGKSFSTVLDDDSLKQIRNDLIRVKYMPAAGESFPEFIDPTIDSLFLCSDKINSEYKLYKQMRFLYQGVKFYNDPPTLLRINMDKDPSKDLSSIIDKIVEETGISAHKLKDIYKTFRELEIQRNYDNDKIERWIETKDIVNQELSV